MTKHPFIHRLTNIASSIIRKYYPPEKNHLVKEIDYSIKYAENEEYVSKALLSLSEIETVFQQLEQSPYFLTNFRQTKSLKSKGIARFDHIIYHIESHLFRATGILDRMLIHVNVVFELGLLPETCKSYNLLKNKSGKEGKYSSHIKNYDLDLYNYLLDLMNIVDTYRTKRNQISHQKRYDSETLKNVEMFHILQSAPDEEFDINHYASFVKRETDKAVKTYKEGMLNFNQKVRIVLDEIYLRLEQKWLTEYENKTNAQQEYCQ